MRLKLLAAALAVAFVPVAVSGQAGTEGTKKRDDTRRVCRTDNEIGSRLARTRRCSTRQEAADRRADERRTIDRVQSLKVTFEQ